MRFYTGEKFVLQLSQIEQNIIDNLLSSINPIDIIELESNRLSYNICDYKIHVYINDVY